MTEKRFTISIDSNDRKSIWDDERTEEEPLIALNRFGEIWGIDDCCKLLNEQHEQIEDLKDANVRCCNEYSYFHKRMMELEKENEQLKKDVDYWKQVASQYSNELNVFEHCKKYKTECKDIHWSSDRMTEKRFIIDNNIEMAVDKVDTYELSTLVDTDTRNFYFIVDDTANIQSFCDRLNRLSKENEELKKELERCRDWLNSDKNDYELTLAFIKNKGYSLKDVLKYEKELKKE